ncbi:MAG: ATP-binding protein [Methylomicrobium sp.]
MMESADIQIDVVIPTQTKYLDLIGSIGERIGRELDHYSGDRDALAYQLNLVLTEATTNAIKHSNADGSRDSVRIKIHIQDDELTIKVFDHGQGFDIEAVPLPDFDNPKENGMGIYFIRTLMDSVTYTRLEQANVLEIKKRLR